MGNLLGVKPVLTLRDGKLDLLEKVRTRSKALSRVVELTGEALAGRPIERLAVVHVTAEDQANEFAAQLRGAFPCPREIIVANLTAGLSVHTGAGMLGVAFVAAGPA
jgi:fatty acid-binding protein DegV